MERYTATRENDIIKEIFLHNKTMSAVAREQGVTIDRIRQIKEKGLRRLRMGKAKRELLEKFDIAEAGLFRGGLNNYKEHNFTSIVEHLAEKRLEAETRYKRHLAEIEEMHRIALCKIRKSQKTKRILPNKGNCVILSIWENHRAKGGFTPLFYSEGSSSPPDERKEGDAMYVTYQDLIQIGILIVALANLFYQIYKGKKK